MNSEIIEESNFEKARKKIRELAGSKKEGEIIFSSSDDELARKILEKEKVSILLVRQKNRKDFSKQRNSGFNQVMARAAKRSEVAVGISLDEILGSRGREKSQILARTEQNIMLCSKNNLKMKLISEGGKNSREIRDLRALGLVLGMPTWMVKSL